jgi:biopolymer transport protein ExbB
VERLIDLFSSGGPVMFFIAGVSLIAWYLSLRMWVIAGSLLKRLQRISPLLLKNQLGRHNKAQLQSSIYNSRNLSTDDYSYHCFAIKKRSAQLKSSLWLIGTLASLLPLLGLLGTVLGMLLSFEVIEIHGTSQPGLLASGIGQALITTQAGLWMAVPILFFHHIIRSRIRLIHNEADVLFHVMQTKFGSRISLDTMKPMPNSHRVSWIGDK